MIRKNIFFLVLIALCMNLLFGCKSANVGVIGGLIPTSNLIDGVYEGTASGGPVKVIAKVTIQGQRITHIELIKHRTMKGKSAEKVIPDRIIEEQSTKVDVVSGATTSSRVIMNAVQDAVIKATAVKQD